MLNIVYKNYHPNSARQGKSYVDKELFDVVDAVLSQFNIELTGDNKLKATVATEGELREDPVHKVKISGKINGKSIQVNAHSRDIFSAIAKLESPLHSQVAKAQSKARDKKRNKAIKAKHNLNSQLSAELQDSEVEAI